MEGGENREKKSLEKSFKTKREFFFKMIAKVAKIGGTPGTV
jgi:hypothetical protein